MTWFALALTVAGCSLFAGNCVALALGRITVHGFNGLCAVSNSLNLGSELVRGDRVGGGIIAGAMALSVWLWWHGGGGDGTKRRFREFGRKFQGVRRTAPAGAS